MTTSNQAAADKATQQQFGGGSEKSAAVDVRHDERARAQSAGAVEGAQSVAEAVRRVADAAVAAVQKSQPQLGGGDFRLTAGAPGGRFEINGLNLSSNGTVKFNGVQATTIEWGAQRIVGLVPAGAKPGVVTVEIDSETKQTGYYRG